MSKRRMIAVVTAFSVAIVLVSAASAGAEPKPIYLDPSQPVDKRVDDLVGRMTLEEKASQLVNRTRAIPRLGVPEYKLKVESAPRWFASTRLAWLPAMPDATEHAVAAAVSRALGPRS